MEEEKNEIVTLVVDAVAAMGLASTAPAVLSDRGNMILHLAPYPVVARVATVLSKQDTALAYQTLERELRVVEHLNARGVPVVSHTSLIDAGPYSAGGLVMTLWDYVKPVQLEALRPHEALCLVSTLTTGMMSYPGELPVLGVWERTCQAAVRLEQHSDHRLQSLLMTFRDVDEKMRSQRVSLVPSHGDAHARNLIASSNGWLWTDFEDACLMPRYWDRASYVANLALFRGLQEPTLRCFVEYATDPDEFWMALTARTLMSVLGNLDSALAGNGDLDYAQRQLDLAGGFLEQIRVVWDADQQQ